MTKEFKVKVNNLPNPDELENFIVARLGNNEFWFYGSYESIGKAEFVAKIMENAFVFAKGEML